MLAYTMIASVAMMASSAGLAAMAVACLARAWRLHRIRRGPINYQI